ncbi:MAG: hypothetical protein WCE63_22090 [Acidobacteriaceae bacterium]
MTPRFALAWMGIVAVILGSVGYFNHRFGRPQLNADQLLNQSVKMETVGLKGLTEHQTLRLDEAGADGRELWHGTIDVWKESDSDRTMRRLYDAQHQLVAAEWRGRDGRSGSYVGSDNPTLSKADREIETSQVWQQDVSARGFQALAGRQVQVRAVGSNYELTGAGMASGPLHLTSATLVLDRHLHVIAETVRVGGGSPIKAARFVQLDYQRQRSASVPDAVFLPEYLGTRSRGDVGIPPPANRIGNDFFGTNVQLVRMQIAVLYELNKLGADIGEPIEVIRTPEGRIRVTGTVEDASRKNEIDAGLVALPHHQLLDIRLALQRDLRVQIPALHPIVPMTTNVYNVAQSEAPAYTLLRQYFANKGWTDDRVNTAVAEFSQDALGHSQRALQHAYALDRLGSAFSAEELQAAGQTSERQWAEMAARHGLELERELQELHQQLTQVVPAIGQSVTVGSGSFQIDTAANFARAATELLHQTQDLNRKVGRAFTSGSATDVTRNADFLVADAMHSIPLQDTAKIASFASRLANSENAAIDSASRTSKR